MTTRRPRAARRFPKLLAVKPLPSEEATPPVTKMCLATEPHDNTVTMFGCTAPRLAGGVHRRCRQQVLSYPATTLGT